MMNRRHFLQATAATALVGGLLPPLRALALSSSSLYLGARVDAKGKGFVSAFDDEGQSSFDLALPARGHGFAQRPGRPEEIVAFGRRPGRFMVVADVRSGKLLHTVEAIENRRYCGHGAFDPAGRLLHVTELEYDTGDGVIGVYDAADGYARVGEFRSGGLDPHEIRLLPDGETLVVANGGILTDPDAPGINLNIDEMDSSLAYLRLHDGAQLATAKLPNELFQLSLRHLAIAPDGMVAVVMQYEGPSSDQVPLVALNRPGEKLTTLDLPPRVLSRLRNYCGSAAFDASGKVLATTSPVGGVTVLWDTAAGHCLGYAEIADGCGLAPASEDGRFIVTSGQGGGYLVTSSEAEVSRQPIGSKFLADGRWDNHMLRLI
ncbi:MAG TPA: DUF1513 domain-containing protein [Alphaproteobacteria bacterium]|jgi:hypothetical protein